VGAQAGRLPFHWGRGARAGWGGEGKVGWRRAGWGRAGWGRAGWGGASTPPNPHTNNTHLQAVVSQPILTTPLPQPAHPQANVCSVQFSPTSPHLLAAGTANCRAYVYDLRKADAPLSTTIHGEVVCVEVLCAPHAACLRGRDVEGDVRCKLSWACLLTAAAQPRWEGGYVGDPGLNLHSTHELSS